MDRLEELLEQVVNNEVLLFPMQGTVQSFDADAQTIEVLTDARIEGANVVVPGVPIIFPGGGDWGITFHSAAGDRVLLVFCSREVYLWLTGQDSQPEFIRPEFRTAIALPVLPRGTVRTAGTSPGITLRKQDNSVSLQLSDSGINAEGNLSVSGDITATGNITAGTANPVTQVSLLNHTHGGVTSGSASTAIPNPGA